MGISFDALILDVQESSKCIVVCPLKEASVVCIENESNLRFLSSLAPYTIVRVEGTSWDLQKKKFIGGEVSVFNVDYDAGFTVEC